MAQPNPFDSSLAAYQYNPFADVSQEQTNTDIASMLANVVGAMVKNFGSPAMGGMSAGAQYGPQQEGPALTSGLDEFQKSLGKGKTPSGSQAVQGGTPMDQTSGRTEDAYQQQRAGERDPNTNADYGYF